MVSRRDVRPTGEEPAGAVARATALGKRAAAWWQATRVARAMTRVSRAAGGVLAGGVAYAVLFALAAILTLGFTAFVAVLGGTGPLRDDLLSLIDENLPGLVDTGTGGLVDPDDLVLSGLGLGTGLVAVAVLLWSATAAAAAMRMAVRTVAEVPHRGAALGRGRDLVGLVTMALAVLVAAVAGLALSTAAGALAGALGWEDGAVVASRVVGPLVTAILDAAVFVLVVRVLARLRPARRDLLLAAGLNALAFAAVRVAGTAVVAGSATTNPLFASVAVIATLLVWLNVLARIILTSVAWMVEGEAGAGEVDPRG